MPSPPPPPPRPRLPPGARCPALRSPPAGRGGGGPPGSQFPPPRPRRGEAPSYSRRLSNAAHRSCDTFPVKPVFSTSGCCFRGGERGEARNNGRQGHPTLETPTSTARADREEGSAPSKKKKKTPKPKPQTVYSSGNLVIIFSLPVVALPFF